MRLTHIRLLADDTNECVAFYRDKLGLAVTLEAGEVYTELAAGDAILGIYDRKLMGEAIGRPPGASGDAAVLTFAVDDVDETQQRFAAEGVKFVTDPHDRAKWYLRVAHFRDPAGNLIEINHNL